MATSDVMAKAKVGGGKRNAHAPTKGLQLRGVHHLALNTDDMKKTVEFYVRVLGMRLIHGFTTLPGGSERSKTRGSPRFEEIRHYFFDMGGDSLLAFFEFPTDAGWGDRDSIASMQHVAFTTSAANFDIMLERLKKHDVEIIYGPVLSVPPSTWSFYFYDPNGIRLEICANLDQGDGGEDVVGSCTMTEEEVRETLEGLTDDEAWIEEMLATLNAV